MVLGSSFAAALRARFTFAGGHPTAQEVDAIFTRLISVAQIRTPTFADWREVVSQSVIAVDVLAWSGAGLSALNGLFFEAVKEELRHNFKLEFKLPPDRPTDDELEAISEDLSLKQVFGPVQREDAAEIVYEHVQFTGKYKYEGVDYSRLNLLMNLVLLQNAKK